LFEAEIAEQTVGKYLNRYARKKKHFSIFFQIMFSITFCLLSLNFNRLSDFFFVAARYAAMFEKQTENFYQQKREDRASILVERELSKE